MSPSCAETPRLPRRAVRWLLPAALVALMPKCMLCLLAYLGVGTALGLGGPEWCRMAEEAPLSWATVLAWIGAAGALCTLGVIASRWRSRLASAE